MVSKSSGDDGGRQASGGEYVITTVNLPAWLYRQVKAYAARREISRSAAVVELLSESRHAKPTSAKTTGRSQAKRSQR